MTQEYVVIKTDVAPGKYYYSDPECTTLHRTNGPAIEYDNGNKQWYQNGVLHRTDGPAVERVDGNTQWYYQGDLHRIDGPAAEYADGTKIWALDGDQMPEQLHAIHVKYAMERYLHLASQSYVERMERRVKADNLRRICRGICNDNSILHDPFVADPD